MALDGVFLRHVKTELENKIINAKVDKIYQPARDELILLMRASQGTYRLLLSSRADSPRVHITKDRSENPQTPPMLCMLLRKRLSGARLRQIRQPALERILIFDFEGKNELGDTVTMSLAAEIMAQYSNVVFVDENGLIVDALRRVDASMSSRRLVLPGLKYEPPPPQDKCCMLSSSADDIVNLITSMPQNQPLAKAVLGAVQGISPVISREAEFVAGAGRDLYAHDLDGTDRARLKDFLNGMITTAQACTGTPHILIDTNGRPFDFAFMKITQYENGATAKACPSFCELLDEFFSQRDSMERMKAKSADLRRLLNTAVERIERKTAAQQEELRLCAGRDRLRIFGDLVQANIHAVERGATSCTVRNFYDEDMPWVTIPLDPALSAVQNAQKYYKDYRRAKTAEQVLTVQIKKSDEEKRYLLSVSDSLLRAENEREVQEIRQELEQQGFARVKGRRKQREQALAPPLEFKSETGFTILVGRNNRQNDQLTLRQAGKNDLWFHTKDIPGSHVILFTGGREADEDSIILAARLAAAHSKASNAGKVPVDWTKVRYVSKPQGAKPGMVIYTDQKTLFVEPYNPSAAVTQSIGGK